MIIDRLDQWRTYAGISPLLAEAFRWLEANVAGIIPGKYPIQGKDLRAIVSDYRTRPLEELKLESHRAHLDIQCVIRGEETMLWAPIESLMISEPHDDAKDVAFYRPNPAALKVRLVPGLFAILLPADGHAPGGVAREPMDVRKIVVKVKINAEKIRT